MFYGKLVLSNLDGTAGFWKTPVYMGNSCDFHVDQLAGPTKHSCIQAIICILIVLLVSRPAKVCESKY